MIVPRYYENLSVLHENTMPARAYYIPASAKSGRYSSTVTAKIAITVLSLVAVTALFLHYKRVMLCFEIGRAHV